VDNLVDVIKGQLPKNSITADAVEQLMEIYKIQTKKATCKAHAQRVLRENAQAQRVADEQQAAAQ
jgi:Arc/MetJ family transcription regulator